MASRGGTVQFDDQSVDISGVDDRRGLGLGGGGLAVGGGGLGIVGLIAYLVIGVLGGGTGGTGLGGIPGGTVQGGSGESAQELSTRCNSAGALDKYTDCRLIKVYNIADEVWSEELARRGVEYQRPRLTFFTRAVRTGCGTASSSTGPFYCPADRRIYFDLGFLEQLQRQFGAQGEFAQAYIVAHEFGHHIQTITGTEKKVRRAQRLTGQDNAYSVALELQADCYAGVWSKLADQRGEDGIALTRSDVEEALNAAQAIGDDRIQQQSAGSVDPESFTHGSSADRASWFSRGLKSGDPASCTTFTDRGLEL